VAGADIAGMEDVRADRLEDRFDLGNELSRRPGHDRNGAGIGAARAAADRRIDNLYALFGEGAVRSRVRSARLQALGFVYRRGLWIREEVDQRLGCNRLL